MKMKQTLKSDSGYALGLVLIFVMAVGTVLGSVMMVTQLSSDAQGRGVDQLTSSNSVAIAVANVLEQFSQDAAASYALQLAQNSPNCGLPEHISDITVACRLDIKDQSATNQSVLVNFTSSGGKSIGREFAVSVDSASGAQTVREVNH